MSFLMDLNSVFYRYKNEMVSVAHSVGIQRLVSTRSEGILLATQNSKCQVLTKFSFSGGSVCVGGGGWNSAKNRVFLVK